MALKEGADYVLILNNDTKVMPDFLGKLVAYAEENPAAGILGPKIITETGELDSTCARRRPELSDYFWRIGPGRWLLSREKWIKKHHYMAEYDFGEVKKVDVISGSCMLIRSDALQEIGLLDEKTFLYMEEFILHEKIRKTKYFTAIVPSSVIIHKKHASIGKINYRATWELIRSHHHYIKAYRDFGKIPGILALAGVGIYRGVGMLRMFLKSLVMRPLNQGKNESH
jgi:GT2 family glycosyltransferase